MKQITAEELAKGQREISVSEFFVKNKHLLGFDNPRKALLTTIKEGVDNAIDATDEARILPDVYVEVSPLPESDSRFKIIIEDNGPGIVKEQIPRIFAKLLYGSKFHHLKQSLTSDQPIIIKKDGKIEIGAIGDVIDKVIGDGNILDVSEKNWMVPAFDQKTNRYEFRQVSHLIKHKRENEIFSIKTQYNKQIKVTGCHSLFSFNPGIKKIESIEARMLKEGDYIVTPSLIPEAGNIKEVNVLEYIGYNDIKNNWFYVYGIKDIVQKLKDSAEIIHKKTSKSRKFYRIKSNNLCIDVLDDSMKEYLRKGFLPLKLIYELSLINESRHGYIVTYYHGQKHQLPISISLDKAFLRFLGIYIAEGHPDARQLGLTFGKHEQVLINEVLRFAQVFGLGSSVEVRDRSIRVKLFSNIFVKFIKNICGKGAFSKKIPEFVFRINKDLRWHFIDGYCQGDGHKVKKRNSLMFTTKSNALCTNLQYLFLMNGVVSSYSSVMEKGLGKKETKTYHVNVYGSALNESHIYERGRGRQKKRNIEYNAGKVLGTLQQEIDMGDLAFVKIKKIEKVDEGYDYVYDISVPDCENFVGGIGGISCHNSRGQQGLGISAAVMYAQLTTGKPSKITAKTSPKKPAHYYELHIDTQKNEPEIVVDREIQWEKEHGVKIELELEAKYQKGQQSIDEYLKQTAIVNPHLHLRYKNPEGELIDFPRVVNQHPKEPKEIKPHPYGVELGILIKMLKETKARNLSSFLQNEFSRVSINTAKEICEKALIDPGARPERIAREEADALYKAINQTKIMSPPTDCLSPIGEEAIEKGLKKEVNAEFYTAITRPPKVYRGFPFQVEIGLCYGGSLPAEEPVKLLRFANRVPLQYEQSACAITKSVLQTAWKNYDLSQSKGALPIGPAVIMVHIVSVWVPFTSESKEAIASYPEIIQEIKLGLQECGRKLGMYIRKNIRAREQKERANLFERYIPELSSSLSNLSGEKKEVILENLTKKLKKELPIILGQQTENKQEPESGQLKDKEKPLKKESKKQKKEKTLEEYGAEET